MDRCLLGRFRHNINLLKLIVELQLTSPDPFQNLTKERLITRIPFFFSFFHFEKQFFFFNDRKRNH